MRVTLSAMRVIAASSLLLCALSQAVWASAAEEAFNQQAAIERVNALVEKHMAKSELKYGSRVSDATYVRRAYLRVIGRIPTLGEFETFMSNSSRDKRAELIDELIDSPGYVSHSLNLWMDKLRIHFKGEKVTYDPYRLWLRKAIAEDRPYNQLVHDIIASEGAHHDPDNGGVGFYLRDRRTPDQLVSHAMEAFLGTSMACAQCHDHPHKDWTQMDYYQLLAFFEGTVIEAKNGSDQAKEAKAKAKGADRAVVESLVMHIDQGVFYGGSGKAQLPSDYKYRDGKPNQWVPAAVPFKPFVRVDYNKEYPNTHGITFAQFEKRQKQAGLTNVNSRYLLADWMTSDKNPMFAKSAVNRLWDRAFGAPLVGNVVDIDLDEEGAAPDLTEYLIETFQDAGYSQKQLLAILYKSEAFQREAVDTEHDTYAFQGPVIQRLTAEQVWDSVLALRTPKPDSKLPDGDEITPQMVKYLHVAGLSPDEIAKMATSNNKGKKKKKGKNKEAGTNNAMNAITSMMNSDDNLYKSDRGDDFTQRASDMKRNPGIIDGFLAVYGQSQRQVIDEGLREATIPQALYLMNDFKLNEITRMKDGELAKRLGKVGRNSNDAINLIYAAVLSRMPSGDEMQLMKTYLSSGSLEDVAWALLNSNEFKMAR